VQRSTRKVATPRSCARCGLETAHQRVARIVSEREHGHTRKVPEQERPDVRPQLGELLEWYREVLARIEAGAIVEPGEEDRLREEASLVDELLRRLEGTHEPA
jgi:hypothetical protein